MSAVESPRTERLGPTRATLALGLLVALFLMGASAWLRVHAALGDPNFDALHPEGMLKSDPALLFYFVERILESGGWIPADFGAEPRILHPATIDVLAHFPMGYELVVAWCYRLLGGGVPLHVFCVYVAGVCASAVLLGVYGLALELTRRVSHALLAAALWATMLANYRTVGFVLVGEDFSLPWLALHLYLLARARRLRTPASMVVCALALVVALSTWHAAGFFVALEALAVYAWFLRSGENPLALPRAWIVPAIVFGGTLAVPFLRGTRAWASAPALVLVALWVSALVRRRGGVRRGTVVVAGRAASAAIAAAGLALPGGQAEYSHVFGLVWHKLVNVGELPANPNELPGEVRLMWQSSFATSSWAEISRALGLSALPCAWLLVRSWRVWRAGTAQAGLGRDRDLAACLGGLLALSLPLSWLIERTIVLPGMLVPVAAVLALPWIAVGGVSRTRAATAVLAGIALVQGAWLGQRLAHFQSAWYQPPERQTELRALLDALPSLVPADEAIATDFMNSTAILAHSRHPMVLQPKWEDRESRERALEVFTTFFQSTPEAMRRLLLEKYRCRYVLFDRFTLGSASMSISRYVGGLPANATPRPGTCWAEFSATDEARLRGIPGFELVYRSPRTLRRPDGQPSDHYLLYAIRP